MTRRKTSEPVSFSTACQRMAVFISARILCRTFELVTYCAFLTTVTCLPTVFYSVKLRRRMQAKLLRRRMLLMANEFSEASSPTDQFKATWTRFFATMNCDSSCPDLHLKSTISKLLLSSISKVHQHRRINLNKKVRWARQKLETT